MVGFAMIILNIFILTITISFMFVLAKFILLMVGFAIIILTILILTIINFCIIGFSIKIYSLVGLARSTLLVISLAKFIYSWLV